MKTHSHSFFRARVFVASCLLAFSSAPRLHASLAGEAVERLVALGGRFVDDASRAAAREGLEAGIKRYGDEAVQLAERGGLELPKAAARHGDEIWRLAKLSPVAPRALAARAEPLLDLARKYGDDALRIEIKAPGTGVTLASRLAPSKLAGLASHASEVELKRLAALAVHGSSRQLSAAAVICRRGGGRVLEWLTPARIASLGFAAALAVAAFNAPESFFGLLEVLLTGLLGPFLMVAGWLLVLGFFYLLRKPLVQFARHCLRMCRGTSSPSVPGFMNAVVQDKNPEAPEIPLNRPSITGEHADKNPA